MSIFGHYLDSLPPDVKKNITDAIVERFNFTGDMTPIEIDGKIYAIPDRVAELIDSITMQLSVFVNGTQKN